MCKEGGKELSACNNPINSTMLLLNLILYFKSPTPKQASKFNDKTYSRFNSCIIHSLKTSTNNKIQKFGLGGVVQC